MGYHEILKSISQLFRHKLQVQMKVRKKSFALAVIYNSEKI